MDWKNRITSDPSIMFGKPVITGTRVPVDMIVDKLARGRTIEQLLKSYPHIQALDIYACLSYDMMFAVLDENKLRIARI